MDYRLNKIINIIRNLNEEMMAAGNAGFSASADPKGPTAGFDPIMKGTMRRRTILGKGKYPGARTRWGLKRKKKNKKK
tara:strand:+ start:357 stop:590 length:234 start_codon:yes stop_codon:yes gene_type:complete